MSLPRVTVALLVYNEERFVRETLESLQKQNYPNFEVLILDNASSDNSGEICRSFAAKNSERFSYIRNPENLGSCGNAAKGLSLADGKYFAFCGAHDLFHENFLSACVVVLEQDENLVLCAGQFELIDQQANISELRVSSIDTRGLEQQALSRFNYIIWSLTGAYQFYGLYRTSALKRTMELKARLSPDTLLLSELALIGTFAHLNERLLTMRRLPEFGDWKSYFKKMKIDFLGSSPYGLFYSFAFRHLEIVTRHLKSPLDILLSWITALHCVWYRHSCMLASMLEQQKQLRLAQKINAAARLSLEKADLSAFYCLDCWDSTCKLKDACLEIQTGNKAWGYACAMEVPGGLLKITRKPIIIVEARVLSGEVWFAVADKGLEKISCQAVLRASSDYQQVMLSPELEEFDCLLIRNGAREEPSVLELRKLEFLRI